MSWVQCAHQCPPAIEDSSYSYFVVCDSNNDGGLRPIDGFGLASQISILSTTIDAEGRYRLEKLMVHAVIPLEEPSRERGVRKPLDVTVEVDFVRDRYQVTAVHVRDTYQRATPLVSADLARVPLDLILRNAEEAIGRYQFSVKGQTELMLPTRMSELRHPGRRGHPDRHYARIFQTYVDLITAGSDAPISELAQAEQVTTHTARKWVAVARDRGLATSVGRGQMGGSLTELGLEALK